MKRHWETISHGGSARAPVVVPAATKRTLAPEEAHLASVEAEAFAYGTPKGTPKGFMSAPIII